MKQALFSSILSLSVLAAHAQQHFPSNEDLRQLRTIAAPQLSPDLKHVVATVQDSTAEGGKTHLWLLSVDGSPARQLTFSQGEGPGERTPEYLPDGSAILFTSRRDGKSSLFRLPLDGGEAVALKLERSAGSTSAAKESALAADTAAAKEKGEAVGVLSYSISPDGSTVAVVASDPEPAARTKDKREKKDAVWVEHEELEHRVYLVDTKTWKPREVPGLTHVDAVAWSEQSDRLLVLTHTRLRDLGPSTAGFLVSAQDPSSQRPVAGLPESTRRAAWMHDGKSLLLFAGCEKDAPQSCSDLFTFDLASAKRHNLTAALDSSTLAPDSLEIAEDDRTALISLTHGTRRVVARIDLTSGRETLLDFGLPVISGFRHPGKAHAWTYIGTSATQPGAVYLTTDLAHPGTRLVQPEMVPATWSAAPSKAISWKRGGLTIEGLLYLPPQAATGKVPLVVNVHGGPTGQFTDSYSPLTNLLVGQGWAVLVTNPRGSTGYGIAYEAANKDDMGNGDYLDIMAGVDEVIRAQPIDADKMALIGYSYGGEMAGFVEGKTTRFKAIVSGAPVIDQFSEYGTESDSFGDRWFTGQPWRHFESAWRQSPLAYAQHAKTPFLLLQGQADTTDPEGQSQEMYRALRQEGVPVQMLLFPREDHGALGGNFAGLPSLEPWHGITAREHMIHFISDGLAGRIEPNKP